MTYDKEWRAVAAGMLAGRRFSPKQIEALHDMIWREADDGRIELMMLFFAEALHDVLHFGHDRISRVLHWVDDRMGEFSKELDDGTMDVDDVRIRVFDKTKMMFALNEKDRDYIAQLLTAAGYDVTVDEKEENDG